MDVKGACLHADVHIQAQWNQNDNESPEDSSLAVLAHAQK